MDTGDWVGYFVLLAIWIRSAIKSRKLVDALEEDGRQFGSMGVGLLGLAFLPWSMGKANKEFIADVKKENDGKANTY
jgi:hypothetical protein